MENSGLQASRKAILVVLFVPSVERDGTTSIDQVNWSSRPRHIWATFRRSHGLPAGQRRVRDDKGDVCWSRTNPLSFTATRRPRISQTRLASVSSGVSAGEWAARPTKAKSGWSSGTNIWRSEISRRNRA